MKMLFSRTWNVLEKRGFSQRLRAAFMFAGPLGTQVTWSPLNCIKAILGYILKFAGEPPKCRNFRGPWTHAQCAQWKSIGFLFGKILKNALNECNRVSITPLIWCMFILLLKYKAPSTISDNIYHRK